MCLQKLLIRNQNLLRVKNTKKSINLYQFQIKILMFQIPSQVHISLLISLNLGHNKKKMV